MSKKIILSVSAIVAFGIARAQAPLVDWARGMGNTGMEWGHSVVNDAAGNTYTVGIFSGTVDFDPGTGVQNLTSNGGLDIFIQALDEFGNYVWAKSIGGTGSDQALKIALDATSNELYITGSFQSTVDFDPDVPSFPLIAAGTDDGFILRITTGGVFSIAYQFGNAGSSTCGTAIAVAGGNVYTAGSFTGTVDFDHTGGTTWFTSAGANDMFVHVMTTGGAFSMANQIAGTGNDTPQDIAVSNTGDIITTGKFLGTADFDPTGGSFPLTSTGIGEDIFICQLTSAGILSWAVSMGANGAECGTSVTINSTGDIISCGYFTGTVDFNPGVGTALKTATWGNDAYVLSLNSAGTFQWVCALSSSTNTNDQAFGVTVDATNNVYTVGTFGGTVDFDPSAINSFPLSAVGSTDIFVQKLNSLGNFVWAGAYGSTGQDAAGEITLLTENEFWVTGFYSGTINFDPQSCLPTNIGYSASFDAFVTKWKPLESSWHQQTNNTTASESGTGVITDLDGNVYVVGVFRSSTDMGGGAHPDITINSGMGSADENTYAAKYDPCGNLIWVVNTTNATDCQGATITYDRVNDRIYIGGTFNGNATFNSSQSMAGLCTTGFSQALSSPEPRGFVAQYNATTGCLNYVEALDFGIDTRLNALTINENNGNVYAGGSALAAGFTIERRAWVRKYTPTSLTLGPPIWSITDVVVTANSWSVVNDLDYHETNNRILIIGDFRITSSLFNGASTSTVNASSLINDAFMAIYRDVTPPSMLFHRAGGTGPANYMTGEGICVDPFNGRVYFTGSYNGTINNPFGFGSIGAANLTGIGTNKAYMMSLKVTVPLAAWAMSTSSGVAGGSSFGKDVVAHDQQVYFLGEFSNSTVTAPGHGVFAFVGGTAGGTARHVYVTSYTEAATAIAMNVTQASTPTAADTHTGVAIESDRNGYSYVTGQFSKQMHYLAGTPPSGPLVSATGAPNAYIMRVDESNTQFRNEMIDAYEENAYVAVSASEQFLAFPNPTNGQLTIAVKDFDPENKNYKLVVYNALGKLVQTVNLIGEKTTIDLSSYENGIYLLNFTDGKLTNVVRISKTN